MPSFVSIDVETANPFMGSICQIGAVKFREGKEIANLSWLINPRDDFEYMNILLHGISAKMVQDEPSFAERHDELCEFVAGSITVSHTHFDRVSIAQACAASQLDPLNCIWLDSARVARRTWPEVAVNGYGLSNLARRLGITFRHHDALEDARAAGLIFLRAIEESGLPPEQWLARVERPINPSNVHRESIRRTGGNDGPLAGHSVVFTGALALPRLQAADRAQELGAAVEANVTKRTTMLVVGDQDITKLAGHTKSTKHRKAEALIEKGQSIRIVAERDFTAF